MSCGDDSAAPEALLGELRDRQELGRGEGGREQRRTGQAQPGHPQRHPPSQAPVPYQCPINRRTPVPQDPRPPPPSSGRRSSRAMRLGASSGPESRIVQPARTSVPATQRTTNQAMTTSQSQAGGRLDTPPDLSSACRSRCGPLPGQAGGIPDGGEAQQIGRLRVAAQHLHRQDDRQLEQTPAPPQPEPAIDRAQPQRQPGRADQEDDVADTGTGSARRRRRPSALEPEPVQLVPHDRIRTSIAAKARSVWATT